MTVNILVKNNYEIVAVITAPDKPAGRGKKIQQSAIKKYALEHNLNILQPTNLKDPQFIDELKNLNADLQIVVAFRMLPEIVWNMPLMGTFNLHASLLPQYRGAAPINWTIINGEKETGVTTFFLDKEIDTGKIIASAKTEISNSENAGDLHDRLMNIGSQLVLETTQDIKKGEHKTIAQNESDIKHAPKLNKENCRIEWRENGINIYNLIRGLSPYPAAYTYLILPDQKELKLKIYQSRFESSNNNVKSGTIETDNKSYFKVKCCDGWIFLEEIQLESKKRMKTLDFLRGFKIEDRHIVK